MFKKEVNFLLKLKNFFSFFILCVGFLIFSGTTNFISSAYNDNLIINDLQLFYIEFSLIFILLIINSDRLYILLNKIDYPSFISIFLLLGFIFLYEKFFVDVTSFTFFLNITNFFLIYIFFSLVNIFSPNFFNKILFFIPIVLFVIFFIFIDAIISLSNLALINSSEWFCSRMDWQSVNKIALFSILSNLIITDCWSNNFITNGKYKRIFNTFFYSIIWLCKSRLSLILIFIQKLYDIFVVYLKDYNLKKVLFKLTFMIIIFFSCLPFFNREMNFKFISVLNTDFPFCFLSHNFNEKLVREIDLRITNADQVIQKNYLFLGVGSFWRKYDVIQGKLNYEGLRKNKIQKSYTSHNFLIELSLTYGLISVVLFLISLKLIFTNLEPEKKYRYIFILILFILMFVRSELEYIYITFFCLYKFINFNKNKISI
jgi:hypothetical protein